MSDYGLRIKNIEASTLFEMNNGVRDHFEYKNSMFTNSLFHDFLITNGMEIMNGKSTKDLICLEFNYASRSYEEEIDHLKKLLKKCDQNDSAKIQRIHELSIDAEKKEKSYHKKTKEELRTLFYNQGVDVTYISKDANGDTKKSETLHYKMLYRSTGKAKKGSCMFIADRLYETAKDYLSFGIRLPETNAPIVEMSAYAPLVSSTIIDRVQIKPENILILKDVESFFQTNIISVETDENQECIAKKIPGYKSKNTLFDGQALIDQSIFPNWGNGYLLLRHHFCKMACFCSNIQLFFRDYFGDAYETATVTDLFGQIHNAKDIVLITTDDSMKWLKFGVSYEHWCNKVHENNCMFGIIKTAYKSKLNDVQKMSYQMINSLNLEIMPAVAQKSVAYIEKLKTDDAVFLEYLDKNKNFSNDYEVLIALVNQNSMFLQSEYFRCRKKKIIEGYTMRLRNGEPIQNADNLVIVGSPYAMLLHAVGEDVQKDDTFSEETDSIQCFTERFSFDTHLACFRSPFNSKNNMGYLHNVYSEKLERYFRFGEQMIAVNLIHTDFQDRNNGSDQDSDSIYTTDQSDIAAYANYCYHTYPTIVNNIAKEKNNYDCSMDAYARLDNTLAQASRAIGESSNLAQLALTYTYNNIDNDKYNDYVCILSVLAQVAIDNAKRRFAVDITKEINRLKQDMNVGDIGYPVFWKVISKDFNKQRINTGLVCPMNYLYELKLKKFRSSKETLPMSYFFQMPKVSENRRKCQKVEEIIQRYSLALYQYNTKSNDDNDTYLLLRDDFNAMIDEIRRVYLSNNYIGLMVWLLEQTFPAGQTAAPKTCTELSTVGHNKSLLLKTLYDVNSSTFLKCFSGNHR